MALDEGLCESARKYGTTAGNRKTVPFTIFLLLNFPPSRFGGANSSLAFLIGLQFFTRSYSCVFLLSIRLSTYYIAAANDMKLCRPLVVILRGRLTENWHTCYSYVYALRTLDRSMSASLAYAFLFSSQEPLYAVSDQRTDGQTDRQDRVVDGRGPRNKNWL